MNRRDVHVLVVDDEPLNRELLIRALRGAYDVREAEDAEAALGALEKDEFAAVVCDHMMPGQNGADLARVIRKRWPATVLILLTGSPEAAEVQAVLGDGTLDALMEKPLVIKELQELVAQGLAGRGILSS